MKRRHSSGALRKAGLGISLFLTAGTVANAVNLRRRVASLAVLEPSDEPVRADYRFVTAAGVELDEATRRAASAYAIEHGLNALDLVPADLPTERALELARRFDPVKWRSDPFTLGGGAYHALLATVDVLSRAGIDETDQLDPVAMALAAMALKQYASTSTDLAVAPNLLAIEERIKQRRRVTRVLFPVSAKSRAIVEATPYAGLALAAAANPVAGAVAAALYSAQPYAIFGAGPRVVPRDLSWYPLTRLVNGPKRWLETLRGEAPPSDRQDVEARVAAYAADIAKGLERFFEPRRETCPWCESSDLSVMFRTADLIQAKPGEFTLEKCGACGHIFQNPRLSIEGLDFYYRDFYDGRGADITELGFGRQTDSYAGRVNIAAGIDPPKRWLDVGTGHGHFCAFAKQSLPDTVFDGLDMSDSIEEAERRGWVQTGYRGMFPDLADAIAGRYDVVSMHHYLEHTREPFDELDAAAKALTDGGHLLIEVPNPESQLGQLLGKLWVPWFQPQHQHLISFGNLERALADRGFTVVAADRGEATISVDFAGATFLLLRSTFGFSLSRPAAPKRTGLALWGGGLRQALGLLILAPVMPVAALADVLTHQYVRRTDGGNAYRLLAKKQGG